jgi:hypothetical protein
VGFQETTRSGEMVVASLGVSFILRCLRSLGKGGEMEGREGRGEDIRSVHAPSVNSNVKSASVNWST